MQPRLFKTSLATYVVAEWDGTNPSGWEPLGDRVLIRPDQVAAKTAGGVELPDDIADRMTMAAEAGIIVAMGAGAFKYNADKITKFVGTPPKPGDRVSMGRYSGQLHMGHDGVKYRIVDSSELGAKAVAVDPPRSH